MNLAARQLNLPARYTIQTVPHGSYPFRIPFGAGGSGRGGQAGAHGGHVDLNGAFHQLANGGQPLRAGQSGVAVGRFRGRQLLDNEALSCLLILLFIDEPKLNIARLHRVLRHLSNHAPTRQWLIQSLLAIMERARETRDQPSPASAESSGKQRKPPVFGTPSK